MSEDLHPSVAIIGLLNIDYFTRVEYLPAPGETVPSDCLELFHGGKGANQAISISFRMVVSQRVSTQRMEPSSGTAASTETTQRHLSSLTAIFS